MKNKVNVFKTTEIDFERIKNLAYEAGLTKTEFIIRSCLNKKIVHIDDLKENYIQLKRIGNNINQLARLSNMGKLEIVNLDEVQQSLSLCLDTLVSIQERIQ
ncbi:MAG: MobC family plasmid mobilization relaxosome protein [Longicatena sp.]|uniref:MobC family plasmid mobilization relaxosome protein n=1 Tax=Anaerorhabdus sp. TaxID=1872524 RepID=UPI002FC85DB8